MAVNAGGAVAATEWLPLPSYDHMFDLDDALTWTVHPVVTAVSVAEVVLPTAGAEEVVDVVCSICTEGFGGTDEGKRVPCGHVYHRVCISSWVSRRNTCPLCRAKVAVAS